MTTNADIKSFQFLLIPFAMLVIGNLICIGSFILGFSSLEDKALSIYVLIFDFAFVMTMITVEIPRSLKKESPK